MATLSGSRFGKARECLLLLQLEANQYSRSPFAATLRSVSFYRGGAISQPYNGNVDGNGQARRRYTAGLFLVSSQPSLSSLLSPPLSLFLPISLSSPFHRCYSDNQINSVSSFKEAIPFRVTPRLSKVESFAHQFAAAVLFPRLHSVT